MWAATSFTETEVLELELNISTWRGHFRDNYTAFVKCTHEKFHKLLHVPDDIREHGVPGNHCTNTWEQGAVSHPTTPDLSSPSPAVSLSRLEGHGKVKAKDRMTNNRFVPELQIMKLLRVQEHFDRGHHETDSSARAMFSVNSLI
jgi:hypothetical protein